MLDNSFCRATSYSFEHFPLQSCSEFYQDSSCEKMCYLRWCYWIYININRFQACHRYSQHHFFATQSCTIGPVSRYHWPPIYVPAHYCSSSHRQCFNDSDRWRVSYDWCTRAPTNQQLRGGGRGHSSLPPTPSDIHQNRRRYIKVEERYGCNG